MARPKEGLNTLPEGWYDKVLSEFNSGASEVEIKAWIYSERGSFSNDLWERWLKEEPEFSETIKMGRLLSEAWWSKEGRTNLTKKEFNYVGWYMNMKNRFGWSDKQEVQQTGDMKHQITVKWDNSLLPTLPTESPLPK